MKWVRMLSRIALLSAAAAAIAGLTAIYEGSVRSPLPSSRWREARRHRPAGPEGAEFPEFIGGALSVVMCAAVGRIALRLRLSPVSRNEKQPILLNLHRGKSLP